MRRCGPFVGGGATLCSDMPFDPKAMGKRIENLALTRGVSLRHIGEEAGVGISSMSRLVNGQTKLVSVEVVVRLAESLGVSLEWLVLGDVKRRPSS